MVCGILSRNHLAQPDAPDCGHRSSWVSIDFPVVRGPGKDCRHARRLRFFGCLLIGYVASLAMKATSSRAQDPPAQEVSGE